MSTALKTSLFVLFFLCSLPSFSQAGLSLTAHAEKQTYPFYIGLFGGYGTTTWQQLVSSDGNAAVLFSTPMAVSEGGGIIGIYTGYEYNSHLAIEATYIKYPDATITFDSMSLFTFLHDGATTMTTKAESLTLSGKLMAFIPNTQARLFAALGPALVHRHDLIRNWWRVRPSFDFGINYNVSDHVMVELGGNYIAGYGASELNPVDHYVPFLYSYYLKLAYRF